MKIKGNNNMNNNISVKYFELKDDLKDSDFYSIIDPLLCIYKTSDFIIKIAQMAKNNPDMEVRNMTDFKYKNRYVFNHLPKGKNESTKIAYERGQQIGSDLTDYDFSVVDNGLGNNFCIIKLNDETDNVKDYATPLPIDKIDEEHKSSILKSIENLAKAGVIFPPKALAFNPQNQSCKIFDYSDVSINGFSNQEDKELYMEAYRKLFL